MLSVFIRRPLLALVPAALLLALGVWSRSRVDLLLIYPILVLLSAIGLVGVVRALRAVR